MSHANIEMDDLVSHNKLVQLELAVNALKTEQRNRCSGDLLEPCWCPQYWRDLPGAHHPKCQAVQDAIALYRTELIVGGHSIDLAQEGQP